MGSRGSGSGRSSYPAFPVGARIFGGRGASPADRSAKRAIVSRFMSEAKVGNIYSIGGGIGSAGGERFSVVSYGRSPNKMGIRSSSGRTVAMTRENVSSYIANGATLVGRGE